MATEFVVAVLIGLFTYRIVDGRIEMQAIRNNRATAAVRRAKQKG